MDPTFRVGNGDDSSEVVHDVDFVLFAGDLADSAAGSAPEQLLLNVLGILPPSSPYCEDGGREMLEIRNQLALFDKPFYAVPGNHDGYAGYGGILNVLVDEFGNAVGEGMGLFNRRLGRSVGNSIKGVNDYIPTFIGWRLLNRQPRYDGLHEYQNYLGPLNVAFKFRGHSFIGLNTYDLKARERSSIGGVVLHWGGGLQDATLDWSEQLINDFAPEADREQFLFLHHDPRAAAPTKDNYTEQQFGYYDAIDTPISWLTLGHLGFGNSPRVGLYLPTISFAATFLWRTIEIGWGDAAGTVQQVWMRKPDWGLPLLGENEWPRFFDFDGYNSRGFVDVINCNLAGRKAASTLVARSGTERCADPQGNISQILIAHDNVPVDTYWADENGRGAVFREPQRGQLWRGEGWEISGYGQFGALFGLKFRSGSPPMWAQEMLLDTELDGNAEVLRMDDVGDAGNYHGFHIITLYGDGEKKSEWIPLPR